MSDNRTLLDEMDARYVRREEMTALRNVFMEEMRNGFAKLETTFTTSFSALRAHMDERMDRMEKDIAEVKELVGIDKTKH